MSPGAIDPSMAAAGPEWAMPRIDAESESPGDADGTQKAGFGAMLAEQLQSLSALQSEAAEAATALATGRAADPTSVVTAIERAQLSMQLAAQVRTKATDAINDIFHTTV